MKVKEITSKTEWNSFLNKKKLEEYPLFQTWEWGEVQKKLGSEIIHLGLYSSNSLNGVSLVVEVKAKRGHFLHLRHGPVFLNFKEKHFDFFIKEIEKIAKEKDASFIRISPLIKKEILTNDFFKKRKFIDAPIHNMDAEICWILRLDKSEDDLLKDMRKTHRYLIRKAMNMNIKIIRTQNVDEIKHFLKLYDELSHRKHFIPHKGVREEMEEFVKKDKAILFLAEFEKKIISAALIIFAGDMAIYHHGASSSKYPNIPVSYFIQWKAILEAKRRKKKVYNFWGIAPTDSKNHPWYGHTLFKTGFGGEKVEFIHAKDLPLNIKYWKNYLIENVTKIRKGYQ